MAVEGLLALLSGGMSGYGQGRQDYRARQVMKTGTPPVPPAGLAGGGTGDLVADFDRNIAAAREHASNRFPGYSSYNSYSPYGAYGLYNSCGTSGRYGPRSRGLLSRPMPTPRNQRPAPPISGFAVDESQGY